jgi:hypothetical protein
MHRAMDRIHRYQMPNIDWDIEFCLSTLRADLVNQWLPYTSISKEK